MTKQTYHQDERDKMGALYHAGRRFEGLPQIPMLLDGKIGVGLKPKMGRIVVRPLRTKTLNRTNSILDEIPTIEPEYTDPDAYVSLYVDIERKLLGSESVLRAARNTLHEQSVHPATRQHYYVTPDRLLIRETMAAIKTVDVDSTVGLGRNNRH